MSGADPGLGDLRPAVPGMPVELLTPPVVAESGDPFTALRVVDLIARVPRGRPIRIADLVARLNATHLDWLFGQRVVEDALLQLGANWNADFRSTGGLTFGESERGATVTLEDSVRVDPWLVGQARRLAAESREVLADFSRRDRITGDG